MSTVSIGNGCDRKGEVLHLLVQVLGFWLEQSRPDRDSYVTIHYDNIKPGKTYMY